MGDKTAIEWCESTWNPIVGCSKVSEGCANCYAERMVRRFPHMTGEDLHCGYPTGWDNRAHFMPHKLKKPLHWRKPRRIFVCSMGDLFHESVTNEQIVSVFITMGRAYWHTYFILTKSPSRMLNVITKFRDDGLTLREGCSNGFLPNVWLGVSVENQKTSDERIPLLLQIPAAKRFVSVEPMLGKIDMGPWIGYNPLHESNRKRDRGLCSSETWMDRGEIRRLSMENSTTSKEQVGWEGDSQECDSKENRPVSWSRISTCAHYGRRDPVMLPSSSTGVATLQRTDSRWSSNQSQERNQARQQALQSRDRNTIGEYKACLQTGSVGRAWGEESRCETERFSDRGDSFEVFTRRGDASDNRCRLRGMPSDDIGYREGEEARDAERTDCRLHFETTTKTETEKSKRSIHMIIVGAETGPGKRPMDLDWARDLRDQCVEAGVPFFFKKDSNGSRELDGRRWEEFPR